MTDDIVARLREFAGPQYPDDICGKAAMGYAADEIERLRKQISVMEADKRLEKAALTFGYVRQTFETGTGDFSKFKGINDD